MNMQGNCDGRLLMTTEGHRLRLDGRAAVGSLVRVRDLARGESFEYELVGPLEGDPAGGRISTASPIGRALIGQRSGSYIEVGTPQGVVALQVLDVRVPRPTLASAAA